MSFMKNVSRKGAERGNTTIIGLVAVLVVAVLAYFGYRTMQQPEGDMPANTVTTENPSAPTPTPTTSPTPTPATPPNPTPAVVPDRKKYADGTYTAEGTYTVPNGKTETLVVTVTLANGVITKAGYTSDTTIQGSIAAHKLFDAGYQVLVVGKSIDEVKLGVVNGSSLTGIGFNAALEKIKAQAAAKASI